MTHTGTSFSLKMRQNAPEIRRNVWESDFAYLTPILVNGMNLSPCMAFSYGDVCPTKLFLVDREQQQRQTNKQTNNRLTKFLDFREPYHSLSYSMQCAEAWLPLNSLQLRSPLVKGTLSPNEPLHLSCSEHQQQNP